MDQNTTSEAEKLECQDELKEPGRMNETQSLTMEKQAQDNAEPTLLSSTVPPLYFSVMDDEGSDEVFVQTLYLSSRLDSEEGSACEAPAANPCVNLRSSDATTANTNPERLDWHHGERPLTASSSQLNEEMESAITHLEEVATAKSSGEIQCTGQDPKLMEDNVYHANAEIKEESLEKKKEDQWVDLTSSVAEESPNVETGLTSACLNLEGPLHALQDLKDKSEDYQNKMDGLILQSPDISVEEDIDARMTNDRSLDKELTGYDWVKRTSVEDAEVFSTEDQKFNDQDEETETIKESRIATEILHGEDLLQRLQLVQQRQDIAEHCQPTHNLEEDLIMKGYPAKEDSEIIQEIKTQTEQEPENETSDLTITATFEHFSNNKACTNEITSNEECDIRNDVNSTESRDDEVYKHLEQNFAESTCKAKKVVKIDQLAKDWGLEDECQQTKGALKDEQTCAELNNETNYEGDSKEEKEKTSSPCLSPQQTNRKTSDTEKIDTWMNESRISVPLGHRLSAAETYMEKQFQESSQIKRELQRAEGVYDLTENPDILEIPFKTSISLDPLPTRDDPVLGNEWRFSEQKMQKEISQEMQRELVLVNLGKIPGGYSKGESRHMKDTKLVFEVFQQDKTEGPARIRKPQTSSLKSQVYPSVLERTRSLEMFSLKMSPMLRAHSFRLMSSTEGEKHPDTFRSQSPSLRDKVRLSPYSKHEKLPRKHKSMDSINKMNSTSVDRVRNSNEEPVRESSPILKENPFFKLRPALSLQPEVEKDIREAKKREEELRKQRSCLYGETRHVSKEEGKSTAQFKADTKQKPAGKLERVWPPPPKKDPSKAEQEARVQRGPGSRAALWQRWESGLFNGQTPSSSNDGQIYPKK